MMSEIARFLQRIWKRRWLDGRAKRVRRWVDPSGHPHMQTRLPARSERVQWDGAWDSSKNCPRVDNTVPLSDGRQDAGLRSRILIPCFQLRISAEHGICR